MPATCYLVWFPFRDMQADTRSRLQPPADMVGKAGRHTVQASASCRHGWQCKAGRHTVQASATCRHGWQGRQTHGPGFSHLQTWLARQADTRSRLQPPADMVGKAGRHTVQASATCRHGWQGRQTHGPGFSHLQTWLARQADTRSRLQPPADMVGKAGRHTVQASASCRHGWQCKAGRHTVQASATCRHGWQGRQTRGPGFSHLQTWLARQADTRSRLQPPADMVGKAGRHTVQASATCRHGWQGRQTHGPGFSHLQTWLARQADTRSRLQPMPTTCMLCNQL